jgi:hypothetical protein
MSLNESLTGYYENLTGGYKSLMGRHESFNCLL